MKSLRWISLGALLLASINCGVGCRRGTDEVAALTGQARCEDLVVLVRASGEIRAAKSNRIYPQLKRSGTIEYIVGEGERVTNNQVVARFSTDDIEKQIRDYEGRVIEQENRLYAAQTALEVDKMDNAKNLKSAEQAVRAAEMKLKKYREGDAPLERRKARLQVETTGRELTMKETRVKDIEGLLKEGFVTQDQVEEERIALERAKVAHETAKVEESLKESYTLPLRETESVNAVDAARTNLEKVRKSGEVRSRQKKQDVESARRRLDATKEELADLREQLVKCVVRAPTEGVVTYGDPNQPWRRSEVQVGAQVHRGQVLMTIPDMSRMIAAVNVSEADVSRVALKQSAVVRSEAMSDVALLGEVSKVAEVANSDGWRSSDVKEFLVEISLGADVEVKPGYSCRSEIEVQRIEKPLTVPLQAIFREEDSLVVYRLVKGRAERTEVRVGESSETRAQILEGLSEGDTVMLVAPGS